MFNYEKERMEGKEEKKM
jgi:hypothetical protein